MMISETDPMKDKVGEGLALEVETELLIQLEGHMPKDARSRRWRVDIPLSSLVRVASVCTGRQTGPAEVRQPAAQPAGKLRQPPPNLGEPAQTLGQSARADPGLLQS